MARRKKGEKTYSLFFGGSRGCPITLSADLGIYLIKNKKYIYPTYEGGGENTLLSTPPRIGCDQSARETSREKP